MLFIFNQLCTHFVSFQQFTTDQRDIWKGFKSKRKLKVIRNERSSKS